MFTKDQAKQARQWGRQWAKDRRSTGSTWGAFLMADALPVVGGSQDLAYLMCREASREWKRGAR